MQSNSHLVRRGLGALVTTALVAAGPATMWAPQAQAASGSITDPRADVTRAYADIVSLRADNGAKKLKVTIGLRELAAKKTTAYVVVGSKQGHGEVFAFGTDATGNGHRDIFVRLVDTGVSEVVCDGFRVRLHPRRDELVAVAPRTCLGDVRRTVRLQGLTEGTNSFRDLDDTRSLIVKQG